MSVWTDNTGIASETRTEVFTRDFYRCVWCESRERLECAHVVPRRRGGKGIPTNLVTLCHDCHHRMDYTPEGKEIMEWVKLYMSILYPGWSEDAQIYRKGSGGSGNRKTFKI